MAEAGDLRVGPIGSATAILPSNLDSAPDAPPPAIPTEHPWSRQPGESAKYYGYFQAWLSSGTITLGGTPDRKTPGAWIHDTHGLSVHTGANVASKWSWQARAAAWDARKGDGLARAREDVVHTAQMTLQRMRQQLASGADLNDPDGMARALVRVQAMLNPKSSADPEEVRDPVGPVWDLALFTLEQLHTLDALRRMALRLPLAAPLLTDSELRERRAPLRMLHRAQQVQRLPTRRLCWLRPSYRARQATTLRIGRRVDAYR